MPGVQRTYGKRSRAVYDAHLAFSPSSSPDPHTAVQSLKVDEVKPLALEKCFSNGERKVKTEKSSEDFLSSALATCSLGKSEIDTPPLRRSPRRALEERQVNSVIGSMGALSFADAPKSTKKTSGGKQKQNAKATTRQRIDVRGTVPERGQHTFFDDDDHALNKADGSADTVQEDVEEKPKLRRSPRKAKPVQKLIPSIPRHSSTLEESIADEIVVGAPANHQPLTIVQTGLTRCPYEQHCAEILDLSTHPLSQFSTWSEEISEHFAVTKIAEASFGEVYRLSLLEDISDFCSTDESVFKVIPLSPAPDALPLDKRKCTAALRRAEGMTSPHDVATEVKLLQRMSTIPGFTNFRDVRILQGRPPPAFISAFKAWNAEQKSREKELSHFPDPAKKTSYNEDQLWAVIEMQDAGTDLERLLEANTCTSIFPIWDIFWHTVLSLAKGEEGAEFEHRDLHLGNICVQQHPAVPEGTYDSSTIDSTRKLNFTPLETTIIDYTLSRCLMPSSSSQSPSDPQIAYTDLSLPHHCALFEGDSTSEYQYDIYRYMRGALYFDAPFHPHISCDELHSLSSQELEQRSQGRNWEQFHPQTNLVWLHLILYKLLEGVEWPSASAKGRRVAAAAAAGRGRKGGKGQEDVVVKRSLELEGVLLKVQDLLDPNAICANGIGSATDLVAVAVGEGWLDLEDVVGGGEEEAGEEGLIEQLGELNICKDIEKDTREAVHGVDGED